MFRPEGIYPAMLTPFDDSGRINEMELRRLVDFLIQRGMSGLFPISSVGEGLHMDYAEKCQLMDIVMDQAQGRVPVTPGVVASYPAECIRLSRYAKKIGCAAVLVTPPYFYKPSTTMVERFFEMIIEEVQMPIILYNIPLFTQPVDYDVVKRLARYEYVVAMKDSSGSMVDFLHYMDKIAIAGEDIAMLTGREETLLACLCMGGNGCMTALSCVLPEVMVAIYDYFMAGNIEKARDLQTMVLILIRTMFAAPFPLGFKMGLELRGFEMGPIRLPLSYTDTYMVNTIRSRLTMVMNPILKLISEGL